MKKNGPFFILLLQTLVLCSVTLFCAAPVSCRITEEGIQLLGGDYEAPSLQSFDVLDERSVRLTFSEGVKLMNSVVSEKVENISDSMEHSQTAEASPALTAAGGGEGRIETEILPSEDGRIIDVILSQECAVGKDYELFGTVADKTGNTLTFCFPFTGFNAHVPELIMTEVQIKYAKGKADGKEVFRGQVLLVHLRTAGEGCVDERENLDEATAAHSAAGILDLWSDNTAARFNDNADVIVLRNGTSGAILDAFMYADANTLDWKKGAYELARQAAAAGIYESGEPGEAVLNKGTTPLRAFNRLDAAALQEKVLAGQAYEYPVKNSSQVWEIRPVTPGSLQ